MGRREELLEAIGIENETKAGKLLDEIVFIEARLEELRKLPFIEIHPQNPMKQRATPAAKQYKELLQQYNNSMKLLIKMCGGFEETEETSPLRKWVESRNANSQ
jgi:hypothetical protein